MSLRPIDLQVVLNQMGEVGRKEKNRQDRRHIRKDQAAQTSRDISSQHSNVNDVDKVEVGIDAKKKAESIASKKDLEDKKEKQKKEKDRHLDSKFKGNFIDLRE